MIVSPPVDKEDEDAERWINAVLDLLPKLRAEFRPGTQGISVTPCPLCGKAVSVARSDYNGHLGVQCATDQCMSWRE